MSVITITDPNHLLIDGKDAGNVIDAVRNDIAANGSRLVVDMKAAFDVWFITFLAAHRDDKAAALEAVAQAVAAKEALRAANDAEVAALEADIATLGTKPEAAEIRKQLEISALQRSVDDQMAKILVLQSERESDIARIAKP